MVPDTAINPDPADHASDPGAPVAAPRRHPSIEQWSTIGFKIMLANTLALLLLGLGVVMFNEYKRSLVYTELSLLEDEANLWAQSLSLAGSPAEVSRVINGLSSISSRQAFVFDRTGSVVMHVGSVNAEKENPKMGPLVTKQEVSPSMIRPIARFLLYLFPITYDLPLYPIENGGDEKGAYHLLLDALVKNPLCGWVSPEGNLIFTAAVKINQPDYKGGTLLLVKNSTLTEEAFEIARLDVVRILLAALVITSTLTLYVAFMVARPLNRLARAAAAIKFVKNRAQIIPDLSDRGDEIGALSVVLRETTQALWDRMDEIEQFAADVAHELKNPLTSLRSALETLPRIEDADKRKKLLEIMTEDTLRLDRLITDIAKASRLDAELSREDLYAVRLQTVLAHVLRGYARPEAMLADELPRQVMTRSRNVVLEILLPADLPPVVGNALRLQQVFDNLINNALSFSPDQGCVVVHAETLGNKYVRFMVDDQGPGIPEGKLETIFSRFYSERPQDEAFGTHSGLGLAIVRQIVQAVSGSIHAENRYDDQGKRKGARFVVMLPLAKQEREGR